MHEFLYPNKLIQKKCLNSRWINACRVVHLSNREKICQNMMEKGGSNSISIVGSLRYLTCIGLNILLGVGLLSRWMRVTTTIN